MILLVFGLLPALGLGADTTSYRWLSPADSCAALCERIPPPSGYARTPAPDGSFEIWLRGLPLENGCPALRLYDGRTIARKPHVAVVRIDIGESDLMQCADVGIRLRAEYLYARGEYDAIRFCFTSGDTASFRDWIAGRRPEVNGNSVRWIDRAAPDSSYRSFRSYLDAVFMYAGSYSLGRDLAPVAKLSEMQIGDMFIDGGFPGHVVIVVDMAVDTASGDRVYVLAQGFTPAQDVHILKNSSNADLSPWYSLEDAAVIRTPDWSFTSDQLRRWR